MDRMKKLVLIAMAGMFISISHAQTDAQIRKSIKVFKKDYSKGIAKLRKYMDKVYGFPSYTAWETLVTMSYVDYKDSEELFEGLEITIEPDEDDEDGSKADSSANALKDLLLNSNKEHFINVCRKATTMSTSPTADMHLRRLLVDFEPDTAVGEKAEEYMEEGEDFFQKEDYELAILNYHKAILEAPSYYKATLYLGDAFWADEEYDSAIFYFNKAIELQPGLLEPRKYLIDALLDKELYVRAKKECINAMCVYPSNGIKNRFQQALKQENKYMDEHKIIRDFYANDIKNDDQAELVGFFSAYRAAKDEISKFCNEDGIIEPNGETDDVYLEVYSWRRFIEENEDDLPEYFRFAQKMLKEGYFDCYILTTFFHVDIYPQLKHFMADENNRKRTETYINTYLLEAYKE